MESEMIKPYTIESMEEIFALLELTRGAENIQNPEHHPEGEVYYHLVQTMAQAVKETDDIDLIFAALLHDVGKAIEPRGHDKESAFLIENFVTGKTLWLVENHMRIKVWLDGTMKRRQKSIDLANHPWLPELVHLSRFDMMGRNGKRKYELDKQKFIDMLNDKANKHFVSKDI